MKLRTDLCLVADATRHKALYESHKTLSTGQKGKWVDGYTDFTDFHEIFTDFRINIRENLVKIREIRTSINPI